MQVLSTVAEMQQVARQARALGLTVGCVPTMGALHAGHGSLIAASAAKHPITLTSVFVNPTQFGAGEDLARYPRTPGADAALLGRLGVRWIHAPEAGDLYPSGAATRVVVEGPALPFEGRARPGHFSGVATVVCRLFQCVPADVAYFGAKDWQQWLVVGRMVRDLGLPIDLVVCPTVREPDGLALSSRNAYLAPDERTRAVGLFESLEAAAAHWSRGADVPAVERAMRVALEARGVAIDYAAVADAETLGPPLAGRGAVAVVAGRVGTTRLIDNRLLPARQGTA